MGFGRIPGSFGAAGGGLPGQTSAYAARRASATLSAGPALEPASPPPGADAVCEDLSPAPAPGSVLPFSPPPITPLPGPLTPELLANAYRRLPVRYRDPLTGEERTHDCSPCTYVNHAHADRTPRASAVAELRTAAHRAAHGRRPTLSLADGYIGAIRHAFAAIGLPSEMGLTLSIALSTGVATPATVDRYCHDLSVGGLGLHCTGFVMAYFLLRHGFRPDSAINNYRVDRLRRRTAAEIRPDDVLVWEGRDGEMIDHIAVVSSRVNAARFRIGESTGSFGGPAVYYGRPGGVSISTYEFGGVTPAGAFTVRRNLEGEASTSTVSVYRVERRERSTGGDAPRR